MLITYHHITRRGFSQVMDVISKACRGNYRYIDCIEEEPGPGGLGQGLEKRNLVV
jgi:hypothetical protein